MLTLYLINILNFNGSNSTALFHAFTVVAYSSPLLGTYGLPRLSLGSRRILLSLKCRLPFELSALVGPMQSTNPNSINYTYEFCMENVLCPGRVKAMLQDFGQLNIEIFNDGKSHFSATKFENSIPPGEYYYYHQILRECP